MDWSPSAARTFLQCPRKWYFREKFADIDSHVHAQKEAFFLNELSSVRALRGKIVDQVITRYAIPRLNRRERVDSDAMIGFGRRVFHDQINFAKTNSFRTHDSDFRERADYCALFEIEYGLPLSTDVLKQASDDVESSLRNFVRSDVFKILNEDGAHGVAQRTLKFHFGDLSINSTPDLIVFSRTRSPFIVDWKVELPLYKDHWLQLAIYAYALSRVNPHKDFPADSHPIIKNPLNIDLLEFQLLHNKVHRYRVTNEDLIDLENYIHSSATKMARFHEAKPTKTLDPLEFPTTFRPGICQYCNFKKICWREGT